MRPERQCRNKTLFFLIMAAGAILGCAGRPICEKITDPHVAFQNECTIDQWRMLREAYARKKPSDNGGRDSVFKMEKLYKPILFAHRGGALEAPESTLKAFDYTKFFNKSYHKPNVEATYVNFWTNRILVDKVHTQGGEIYVFITGFGPIPAIDEDLNDNSAQNKIYDILERGVDGIMTDRAKQVRQIMCSWLKKKLNGLGGQK